MEKLHIPTVYLATSNFLKNARLSAEDNGVPGLRIVSVPADKYYSERVSKERAKPVAAAAFDAVIDALIRPITPEEAIPKRKTTGKANIKVTGETYAIALENFNELFLKNHWSDGLPVMPPTPERVRWMLTGTDRSASEEIGTVDPRNGIATIENIAINAVMAGARPEYLPVIIAAIEGIVDKNFDDFHFLTSTGSFNLVMTVSGPVAKEIGMNSGLGFLSYGFRANSTIGRAVRMAMINLGHLWLQENDMALVGRAAPHTFVVIAENQDASPWEPYHVSQGFKPTDSCVTIDVVYGHTYGLGSPNVYGGGAVALVSPEMILTEILAEIARDRRGLGYQRHMIVLNPEIAQELHSRLGYSRESLAQYLYDKSNIPFESLQPAEIGSIQRAIDSGTIPKDRVPAFQAGLKPGGKVPLMLQPGDIHIMVAGGIPGYTLTFSGYQRGIFKPLAHNTKLVHSAKRAR
jgi:hypothetical protein